MVRLDESAVCFSSTQAISVSMSLAALRGEQNYGYFVFRTISTSHTHLHLLDSVCAPEPQARGVAQGLAAPSLTSATQRDIMSAVHNLKITEPHSE
jgi:hypothetical protein